MCRCGKSVERRPHLQLFAGRQIDEREIDGESQVVSRAAGDVTVFQQVRSMYSLGPVDHRQRRSHGTVGVENFDAELLGDWINPDEADQKWKFEKLGDKSYRVLFTEKKEKVSQIEATLFKLQDEWFLDFLGEMPEDSKFPPPIPSHMLFKIVQRSPELKFVFMNIEWLQKHLEKEPKALRHHMLKSGDKPEDKLPVLTAETEELQRFVVKHIKTADAWSEVITLKRAGK